MAKMINLEETGNAPMKNSFGPAYASLEDTDFVANYQASCFCGAVQYEVSADPVDAKICHCPTCQRLHGAPMQWAVLQTPCKIHRWFGGLDFL
jgi:hypothetical protein